MIDWREIVGRRFARFATRAVVARPHLWRVFRGPVHMQFTRLAPVWDRRRDPVALAPLEAAVAQLNVAPARILDVGTGTGVAAAAAREAVGEDGLVVGVDRSHEMLRLAEARGVTHVVAVDAVDLPFRNGTFDAATIAFVLHLVRRPDTVLFDVVRVLRPGAALGVATWASGDDEFTRTWRRIAESYATKEMLADALARAAPSHGRFTEPDRVTEALRNAGLRDVRVERRTYRSAMPIEDYLVGRETTVLGRFLRDILGEALWARFREQVRFEFTERFADPIGDSNEVLLAVGSRD
jgi:ubiquinone/menaquinone biosynthesis C-methylase UbiE